MTKLIIGKGVNQRLTKAGIQTEERFDALVNDYLAAGDCLARTHDHVPIC
jgi:hypothetical protein